MMPEYSIVVATMDRVVKLRAALESVRRQTLQPERVIIVDASRTEETRQLAQEFSTQLRIDYQRATLPSAARQRNQGAESVTTELIAFIDDDVVLAEDLFAKCCAVFGEDEVREIGGVAARMAGSTHPRPRGLLWWYYRLQAGYADATYGARLFGPVINCFPCYDEQAGPLIAADWLNSGCVLFRTASFHAVKFPTFEGYSFMEDVHLSARIARTQLLFFHADAVFEHHPESSATKSDRRLLARQRIQNQRALARDVLGLSGPVFEIKLLLHRVFAAISIVRRREPGWFRELQGTLLP